MQPVVIDAPDARGLGTAGSGQPRLFTDLREMPPAVVPILPGSGLRSVALQHRAISDEHIVSPVAIEIEDRSTRSGAIRN